MVYIHTLRDLTVKTAEIDSIELIRELKRTTVLPFSEENLGASLSQFFISGRDKELMKSALSLIQPVIDEVQELAKKNDPEYEAINLVRAVDMLTDLKSPLAGTIEFSESVEASKGAMFRDIVYSFNTLPKARAKDERMLVNSKLNEVFGKILRNSDFKFNEQGVVGEGELKKARALNESMSNGYFFHVTLEEEIKKKNFAAIKERIPADKLRQYEEIAKKIGDIKNGVERAHEHNMKMVNLALLLYSHVKMLRPK
jgi:hypothetical protein